MWEIVFLRSGKVEVTENENIYTLEKNNILLHAPMEFHRIRSADSTSPTGYILSFYAFGKLPEELKNGIFLLEDTEASQYEEIVKRIMAFTRNKFVQGSKVKVQSSSRTIGLFSLRSRKLLRLSPFISYVHVTPSSNHRLL